MKRSLSAGALVVCSSLGLAPPAQADVVTQWNARVMQCVQGGPTAANSSRLLGDFADGDELACTLIRLPLAANSMISVRGKAKPMTATGTTEVMFNIVRPRSDIRKCTKLA